MSTTYLELEDHIGVEPSHVVCPKTGEDIDNPNAGVPGPLVRQGIPFPIAVNVQETGDTVTQIQVLDIQPAEDISAIGLIPARIIPGTRVIETTSDTIAAALLNIGHYRVCDPPVSMAQTRGRKAGQPNKAELAGIAVDLGIDVKGRSKPQIEAAIKEHNAAAAAATSPVEGGPDEPAEPAGEAVFDAPTNDTTQED